jgi:signal transduction protein with GAF and PtsI domain
MPPNSSARSAPAAGEDITQRKLLQSIVEVARSVFAAAAASVFLVDRTDGTLVFEAVSGEGEEELVGRRFPGGTGIAGWVASFGQPLLVDDVADSPQFARDAAESTGYVPRSIMAAPLIREGECIGVLEVLDRDTRPRGDLGDVGLLGMLATEVALALDLLVHLRMRSGSATESPDSTDAALIQRIAGRLPHAGGPVAATVRRLLQTAADLLGDEMLGDDVTTGDGG